MAGTEMRSNGRKNHFSRSVIHGGDPAAPHDLDRLERNESKRWRRNAHAPQWLGHPPLGTLPSRLYH